MVDGCSQARDVVGCAKRSVVKHEDDVTVIGFGNDAWLKPGCRCENPGVSLVSVHDLEGDRERLRVGVPLAAPAHRGVRDVAEGAVPSACLACEVGQFPSKPTIGVVDAHEPHDRRHTPRLGPEAPLRPWEHLHMIAMMRALGHLAWADDKLFTELAALPPEALDARYAADAWPVGRLAMHIVGGAEWYCYCLAGVPWTDLEPPKDAADLDSLRRRLAELNAVLAAQAELPDELVAFEDEDGPREALRSTILAQACLHSTEHRAQIACALEVNGFTGITLDDYDVWAFAASEGRG